MRLVPQSRPDASMSLLVDLMTTGALDEGYAAAAAARKGGGGKSPVPAARSRPSASVLVLLVIGFLVAGAVGALRDSRPGRLKARDALRTQIVELDRAVGTLAREVDQARAQTATLRDQALGDPGSDPGPLEIAAGLVAVRGPGLRVVIDDAPGTSAQGFGSDENRTTGGGRVLDRDLQRVVNALWAAGAEAISVSGQRLTAASAIRSAGDAVLVDYRPVSPPYVIEAIGDPRTLEADFADSPAGQSLATLHSAVGLRYTVHTVSDLRLPAASGTLSLRYARPEASP